jgi:[acyl-carrier-protein] S-malonyltransferase
MSSTAFLFPGQGSHEVGMGADLMRSDEWVRHHVAEASRVVGEDLERLCLRGPEKRLMRSSFVQPLMTILCLGYWRRLTAAGLQADIVAGHSLGEIAALAASGVLAPDQAVAVAIERGRLMDEAAERTPGGMAAMFVPLDEAEAFIHGSGMAGKVFVANDNAPEQVVVSGGGAELDEFVRLMDAARPGVCRPLRVSGPWHTPLLQEVCAAFGTWLSGVPFGRPAVPFVCNATAAVETDPEQLRANSAGQLTRRVRWRETMAGIRAGGARLLVEIGPRRVLAGLARLNGFGDEVAVRGVDSLRAVET